MAGTQTAPYTNQVISQSAVGRWTIAFILLTAFLNMAGIGIINPVAPFIVGQYVAEQDIAFVVSLIITAYSFTQFLAVPTLGALSDRYGRRPLLLVSLLGSAAGYLIYGIGGALGVLFLGRIIDGLTGGNIAIINAYAADITESENRTRFFGLLGAAAGLGFVAGPALGGLIFRLTDSYTAPVLAAAAVTLFNTLLGLFVMPESLPLENRVRSLRLAQMNPFAQLGGVLSLPRLRLLLLGTFIWAAAFAVAISNFSYLASDRLNWQPDAIGVGFLVWGIVSIIVQAWLIRKLLRRYNEYQLTLAGLVIMAVGFALVAAVAWTGSVPLLWPALIVTAIGNALVTPALTGLLSQAASAQEQGRVQGGGQAVQALARVIGPVWGGWTYQQIGRTAPYLSGVFGLVLTLLIILAAAPTLHQNSHTVSD